MSFFKNKIKYFTVSVFVAILAAILFDVWIVKLFMMDFNDIMVDNAGSGMIVNAIDNEKEAFDTYVHGSDPDDTDEWNETVQATYDAIYAVIRDLLPFSSHLKDGKKGGKREKVRESSEGSPRGRREVNGGRVEDRCKGRRKISRIRELEEFVQRPKLE